MEGRSAVVFLLVVLAAAASLVMLLERRQAPATSSKPFMVVALEGTGNDRTKLALMSHDLSLAGFANQSGQWHAFPGHEHLLPGSTPLPFGNSYCGLIGGLANLPNQPLGRPAMLQATGVLSGYNPASVDDNDVEALKRALATMMELFLG